MGNICVDYVTSLLAFKLVRCPVTSLTFNFGPRIADNLFTYSLLSDPYSVAQQTSCTAKNKTILHGLSIFSVVSLIQYVINKYILCDLVKTKIEIWMVKVFVPFVLSYIGLVRSVKFNRACFHTSIPLALAIRI